MNDDPMEITCSECGDLVAVFTFAWPTDGRALIVNAELECVAPNHRHRVQVELIRGRVTIEALPSALSGRLS
jgi:hypothetical protein